MQAGHAADGLFGRDRHRSAQFADRLPDHNCSPLQSETGHHSGDEVNWGWTLGGGVEYAITNNFTAKVEGLYVDLDTKDNYNLGGRVNVNRDAEFGVLRAGLNYKFN